MSIETRHAERNGIHYVINVVYDTDATPHDADCYTPEDIKAWENGNWWYVGVTVTAEGVGEASLWGIEWKDRTIDDILNDPYMTVTEPDGTTSSPSLLDSLIDEATDALKAERDRLNGLPL